MLARAERDGRLEGYQPLHAARAELLRRARAPCARHLTSQGARLVRGARWQTAPITRARRFCMVTTFYPPYNFGGDGVSVWRLANALAAAGHAVDVVHCVDAHRVLDARPPAAGPGDHPGVRVHRLRSPAGRLSPLATQQTGRPLLKAAALARLLGEPFDVVHFHNISLVGGPAVLAYGDAVKLMTLHDFWLVCPTHALYRFNRSPCVERRCLACTLSYRRPPQLWRYTGLLRRSLEHVDAFIAPSLTSAVRHREAGLAGRIEHLPNFVPAHVGGGLERPARPYVLFVGRLERLKGLHTVIPFFRDYPRAELWVAGSGSEEAALRALGQGSPNVRFLGQLSSDELPGLYEQATAVVYPAINHQAAATRASSGQGAPVVVMEAFSAGTPVLANGVGRVAALVEQTGGGVVWRDEGDLRRALDRLFDDPGHRDALGAAGRRAHRERWGPAGHLERYSALVDELVAARGG